MTISGTESLPHVSRVSPKYVKSSKGFLKTTTSTKDKSPPRKASLEPKVHQGFWPHFCPKHLIEDPAGCSSWSEDKNGKMDNESNVPSPFDTEKGC